jgi:flavin reductase (DIM6/NTAB) family NADH-FMN oxidoreductase RutF
MPTNQEAFRNAMRFFATGVTIITVDDQGQVHGMTANAFTSVSLDPMLVLVCVDRKAKTHAHVHTRQRFCINMLSLQQRTISDHYAD